MLYSDLQCKEISGFSHNLFFKRCHMIYISTIELFSCLMMTGAIWIVQLVHYPSFLFIAKEEFTKFEVFHQRRISFVVMPLMVSELACHIILYATNSTQPSLLGIVSSISLFLIWFVTYFMCIPCHQSLCSVFEKKIVLKLIYYNCYRTALWSIRSIIFFWHYIN